MFDEMYRMIAVEELWKQFRRHCLRNPITTQKTTQKIIEAIIEKSDITQKELAVVIGITEDGVKYHITRLRKKGILKRIGPDKGGYWEIVKD